jgi:hypothetical protein
MQAIQTRYIGPTNYRGSRVVAWCEAGKLIHQWDHSLNVDQNHREAARKLADKLGWIGGYYSEMVGGALPNPNAGYAFVFANDELRFGIPKNV